MKIDFISDVSCPWCAIGLTSLEQAIASVGLPVDLRIHPFELNPGLAAEGEELVPYIVRKYGSKPEEIRERQALIRQRGGEVGFRFGERKHVWNTFDAHRLLHWAGQEGRALELKRALLEAYHTRGENPGARDVLLHAAAQAGLDVERAREVLDANAYADEVRSEIRRWQVAGIHSVPAVIIDDRYLIQGGHPPQVFEQALREAAQASAAA